MDNRVILEATDVRKWFREGRGQVDVLRGISLGIRVGEIVLLEGPSGSGKSTLLTILGCMLTPSEGAVRIGDEVIDAAYKKDLAKVRRKYIGFVFQQFHLFPALTVLENVEYALNVRGVTGRKARSMAEEAIVRVQLSDRRTFLPRDLSGGQKQRVAIARALAGSAPILLADEPTANLDSQTGAEILTLFRSLAKEGNRALLIVTHDHKVRKIADRILMIRDGLLFEKDAIEREEQEFLAG